MSAAQRGVIAAGEVYVRTDGVFESEWASYSMCSDCETLIERIRQFEVSRGCAFDESAPTSDDEMTDFLNELDTATRAGLVGTHRMFACVDQKPS